MKSYNSKFMEFCGRQATRQKISCAETILSKSLFNEKDSVSVPPGRGTVPGAQPWAAAG